MRFTRRTMGKAMIAIGVLGIIVSVAGAVVGRQLVGQVEDSVDDSLVLTDEALGAVRDSIGVTATTIETLQAGLGTLGTTLAAVQTSVELTSTALTNSGEFLSGELPESLDAVATILPTIESIASTIDDALRAVSRAPFGPDYDPEKPFDEAIHELSTAIGPLPEQLRALAGDSAGLADSALAVSTQLESLQTTLGALDEQLVDARELVDRYSKTADTAASLTADSREDLRTSSKETRTLLYLLALVFALGQIVPIWLGAVLLGSTPTQTIVTRTKHDRDDDPEKVDA